MAWPGSHVHCLDESLWPKKKKNRGLKLARPGSLSHYFGPREGTDEQPESHRQIMAGSRQADGTPATHHSASPCTEHTSDSRSNTVRSIERISCFPTVRCHFTSQGFAHLTKYFEVLRGPCRQKDRSTACPLSSSDNSTRTLPAQMISTELLTVENSLLSFLLAGPWGVV